MNFSLTIKMNDQVILAATASTVMAYENICHIAMTYMPERKGMTVTVPNMLGRMMEAQPGDVFSDNWKAVGDYMMEYEAVRLEDRVSRIAAPTKLNGYPVVKANIHPSCVTVMVHRADDPIPFVVATWWPDLKTQWMWGHYASDADEAASAFEGASSRNATRN